MQTIWMALEENNTQKMQRAEIKRVESKDLMRIIQIRLDGLVSIGRSSSLSNSIGLFGVFIIYGAYHWLYV